MSSRSIAPPGSLTGSVAVFSRYAADTSFVYVVCPALATMVQTDPDVLLLDEIFAVGDKDFIPHCVSILNSYKNRGKTIIFASHDLEAIAKHCDKTILLDKGELKIFDETPKVLEVYKKL
ncbi:MAG: hypothetical protein AB1333_02295 [Patescibacteria group bacterium]